MLTSRGFTDTSIGTATVATDQLVPHSIEAEQALLGALIIDPAQMLEVGYLNPKDFYLINHGHLYEAMTVLFEKHSGYDYITVEEYLDSHDRLADIGGPGALADVMNATPISYGAPEYASIIYRHSISRQVIERCMRLTQEAYRNVVDRSGDMLVSEAIQYFSEIDAVRNVSNGPKSISAGVGQLLDRMERIEALGCVAGLQTGIQTLDYILGGFRKKKFYLLAGRPGMGKSALALQIACNMAKRAHGILYFSLEMSADEMAARLISSICGIPYEVFNRPGIGDKWPDVLEAADRVRKLSIIIDDTPALTVANMRSIAQKEMLKKPINFIIVDHGGLVVPARRTGNSYENNNQNADGLQAFAKQVDCPVLCLLQLSRAVENRQDKRPKMHDLRDSGKWEENADGILFLYRDEIYNPDTEYPHLGEINTAKNRGGKTGPTTVYVNVANNQFVDLETRTIEL